MKSLFCFQLLAWLLVFTAACADANGGGLACGEMPRPDNVGRVIAKNSACVDCLLKQTRASLAKCPNDRRLLLLGFYAAIRSEKATVALEFYQQINTLGYAAAEEHVNAGLVYERINRVDLAAKSMESALAHGPDPLAEYRLATYLKELGREGEAQRVLEALLPRIVPGREMGFVQSGGDDAYFDDAALLLADLYARQGNLIGARNLYRQVLSYYPGSKEAAAGLSSLEK